MNHGSVLAFEAPAANRSNDEPTANDRQLLIDSRVFAVESWARSWFEVAITLVAIVAVIVVGLATGSLLVRLCAGFVLGLLHVRMFALFHDYLHSTILKNSKLAGFILKGYGMFLLTPPSVWKRTHEHHHKHNSKLFGANIGSFRIMTVNNYKNAGLLERLEYRLSRSVLVMLGGYLIVFFWGMCVVPFFTSPRKHPDCIASLLIHAAVGYAIMANFGASVFAVMFAMPLLIATAFGSYLFYVQHNFPGAKVASCEKWTYTKAALQSSSFLKMGILLNWFTANIGFHHVHHLNAKIPFYRLSQAHTELTPLQEATQTTLRLPDVWSALQLKLWDEQQECFVGFAGT
jgi:omega-6 fatty acid desaturase (delta-12 desaturase)